MTYSNLLSPAQMAAQLRQLPGHRYWDNTKLQADRFLWSWVNRVEPTSFGGNQQGLAAGATAITVVDLFNIAEANNVAYHAHLGQTPAGNINVAMPTVAAIIAGTGLIVAEYFEFSYTNLSSNVITVTSTAGGLAEVGVMTIAATTTARFRVYIGSATTGSLIRL
jgi:acetylornithine/succinyldiaminopimelate/putrescine aminotransferase|tara:strand:+ start:802 stop:1296 length:495 start_codon:yes stop_codon:yes gene_type:complete